MILAEKTRPESLNRSLHSIVEQYRAAIVLSDRYLETNVFPLNQGLSAQRKERMAKLSAVTLLLQDLNCQITGVSPSHNITEQSILIGGIIDPYDGIQDKKTVHQALEFSVNLSRVFSPQVDEVDLFDSGIDEEENFFYNFLSLVRAAVPPKQYEAFWNVLSSLHLVQTISLLQRADAQIESRF